MKPVNPTVKRKPVLLASLLLVALGTQVAAEPLPSRADRLASLVGELLPADRAATERLVRGIAAQPPRSARHEDLQLAIEFWAMHDPKAALQYAESQTLTTPSKHGLLEAIARGWTRMAPHDAWTWAVGHSTRDTLDLPRHVLVAAAETAPEQGLAFLQTKATTQPPRNEFDYNEHAFAFFYRLVDLGDYETARRLIDEMPAEDLRAQLLYFCSARMARFALEETAMWSLSRREKPDAFYAQAAVAIQKCQLDPDHAFAWVLAVEDDAVRPKLVGSIAADWIEREPKLETARRILAMLEAEPERQAAYTAFAQTPDLVQASPVPVMDWAWKIEAMEARRMSLIRGYSAWHALDGAAARAHLEKAGQVRPNEQRVVTRFLTEEEP